MDEEIQAVIQRLLDQQEGRIRPEELLAEAKKDKGSALYRHFEEHGAFDSKRAKEIVGLQIARGLIQRFKVVYHEPEEHKVDPETFRKIITRGSLTRDPAAPAGEQGYVSIERLRSEPENARAAIIREFRTAAHYLNKARTFAKLLDLEAEVEEIHGQVIGFANRVESEAPAQQQ